MLNQVILVGRLVRDVEVKELESRKKVSNITIACPRSFKNIDGEYETDFIDIILWDLVAQNTSEYCHKGDVVGIKGRLQTRNIENEDGTKNKIQEIIAEKLTFLSSSKKSDNSEE